MSLELGFDEPFFLSQRTSNIHLGPPGKAILPGLGTECLNIFGDELRFLSDLGCFRVFALWKGQTGCFFPNMPWLVVFVFLNGRQRMRTPPSFPHQKLRRGLRGGAGVFAVAVPQPTFAPQKGEDVAPNFGSYLFGKWRSASWSESRLGRHQWWRWLSNWRCSLCWEIDVALAEKMDAVQQLLCVFFFFWNLKLMI